MNQIALPQGTIRYREIGSGPPIVFVHAFMTSGAVWARVAALLADRYRCIMPDWPFGAHELPLAPEAERTGWRGSSRTSSRRSGSTT